MPKKLQELLVSTRPFNAAPAAVTDLSASTGLEGGSLGLTWTAPDDDAAPGQELNGVYLIQRSTEPSPAFDPGAAQLSLATSAVPGAAQSLPFASLLGNATHIKGQVDAATEAARQAGVYPGRMRDLRRQHRLEWAGWQ